MEKKIIIQLTEDECDAVVEALAEFCHIKKTAYREYLSPGCCMEQVGKTVQTVDAVQQMIAQVQNGKIEREVNNDQ